MINCQMMHNKKLPNTYKLQKLLLRHHWLLLALGQNLLLPWLINSLEGESGCGYSLLLSLLDQTQGLVGGGEDVLVGSVWSLVSVLNTLDGLVDEDVLSVLRNDVVEGSDLSLLLKN